MKPKRSYRRSHLVSSAIGEVRGPWQSYSWHYYYLGVLKGKGNKLPIEKANNVRSDYEYGKTKEKKGELLVLKPRCVSVFGVFGCMCE